MTHPISAANPQALFAYASTAGRLDDALLAEVHPLGQALHQFAATCTEYSTGVDAGLATRLRSYAQRAAANDDWVGRVGQAFLAADQSAMQWSVDLGGRAVQAITQPVTEAAHWLVQQDAHSAWQTMRNTLPNAGALLDTITGTARSFQQQAGQWVARAVAVSQQHWQRFWTFASPLLQQLFVQLQAGLRRALSMAATAAEYIAKQHINSVWGIIWGETAFSDVCGGEVVAILGDIIAGVFVVGDIRDVIKYWFVHPFTSDWPWWANAIMGGVAFLGLIPVYGDILKPTVKQILKQLFKTTIKETVEEVAERVVRETMEHLIKELGEDVIKELGEDATKQLVERLGRDLTKEQIEYLVKELGAETLDKLSRELSAVDIHALVSTHGGNIVKWLGKDLSGNAVKEVLSQLTPSAAKALQDISGTEVKQLLDTLNIKVVNTLAPTLKGQGLFELSRMEMFRFDSSKQVLLDAGQGAAVRRLPSFKNASLADIETTLQNAGFTKTLQERGMDFWTHPDGSVIRIKLGSEALQKERTKPQKKRTEPHLVKEVVSIPGSGLEKHVLVKVSDNGAVIPRNDDDAAEKLRQWFLRKTRNNPTEEELEQLVKAWGDSGHIKIVP